MRKRCEKKGYTLIELLATIVVLGILFIIGMYSYNSYIKRSREKIKEIEVSEIINAAAAYHEEFKNTNKYTSYVDDGKVKSSCISVQSLIDMGYYKGDVSFLNEKLTRDNTVIKVKEVNGVANYELITNYTKDKDCIYYDYSSELENNTEIVMNNNDGESDISLSTTIEDNANNKNTYVLKLKFSADVYEKIVNYSAPVYVLLVLDSSGSMVLNNRYTPAVNSSINLSTQLINNVEDSYISLVNFDYTSYIQRDFQHNVLTNNDFRPSVSGQLTNILSSLDTAYNLMSKLDSKSIKYVVFLTDGVPAVPSYSTSYYKSSAEYNEYSICSNDTITDACTNKLIEYSNRIKNDLKANFVVIGYDISRDIYKTISSIDDTGLICPASDYTVNGKKYCYYNSNSANISSLFNSISNSIVQTVKAQSISESIINIVFDKSISLYDLNGDEVKSLSIDIDFDNGSNTNAILNKEYEYLLSVDKLDDDAFTCDFEKKECIYNSNLFEEYYIDLYDMDKNYLNRLVLDSSPIVTINKKLKSYIN